MPPFSLTLNGTVTRADKARNDYLYLPFDLAQRAPLLRVRYRYHDIGGADAGTRESVIDLGFFDPRGAGFPGGAGFRGWSGSARSEFFLAENEATPGYLPGPLPPGRYQVILGLYRIAEAGAHYHVEIEAQLHHSGNTYTHSRNDVAGRLSHPSDSQDLIWLKGDLQSHTHHSDAQGSPEELVQRARDLKLDFLAITDHNTVSHHAELPHLADSNLLLIPGQECTTYYGHMNIWGTSRWCDFRCATADDLAQVIELAHAHGALCSINHPKEGGPDWEYGFDLPVDTMEVWQGPWPYRNEQSLALWDRLLREGRRIPVVGGSDYHCPDAEEKNLLRLGQPTTWVGVHEPSVPGILHAIARGRTTISARPDGPFVHLRARCGAAQFEMGTTLLRSAASDMTLTINVENGQGLDLHLIIDGVIEERRPISGSNEIVEFQPSPQRYVRAELVGDLPREQLPENLPFDVDRRGWRWALTNPIYIG